MIKNGTIIIALILSIFLVGCENTEVLNSSGKEGVGVEKVTPIITKQDVSFKHLEGPFGFADEGGKRIITLANKDDYNVEMLKELNVAVGNNGEIIEIEFVKWQEKNNKDNSRQTMYNFDNMSGHVFNVKSKAALPNEAYLLTKDSVINKDKLIKLKPIEDAEAIKTADNETIKRIETLKNRKIVESRLIAQTYDYESIYLFVFERSGDDMLASLAYVKGEKVVFKDYPAKYDQYNTWRADGGDSPGNFEVMFLSNSDKGLLMGITWGAPEGEGMYILREENGAFTETHLKSGRYWAPL